MTKQIELPDFSEMLKLIHTIEALNKEELRLRTEIKIKEAESVDRVTNDPKFLVDGKTPSVSYIDRTYKITGIEGDLVELRRELDKISADLHGANLLLQFYRDMISVYQTESANKRAATLV